MSESRSAFMPILLMTPVNHDHLEILPGAMCWLWWAAESPEGRRVLLESMAREAGQPVRDDSVPSRVMAAAGCA
jgi:hypothetical protein